MSEKEAFLVIGIVDVGSIARSARSAGYTVYAVDFFGDLDVRKHTDQSLSITETNERVSIEDPNLSDRILELTEKLFQENKVDSILLASGIDDENEMLQHLNDLSPITGNKPDVIRQIRDKINFFKELKRINVPFPVTWLAKDLKESIAAAKDIGFPVVIKPPIGYGGRGVKKIGKKTELKKFLGQTPKTRWLVQEYVPGIPASISILADGSTSKTLTLNEQLLGRRELGQEEDFAYCGNIVPLNADDELIQLCDKIACRITTHYGLKGSNGIDIIYSQQAEEKVRVIEVNPRFQASMECVERYLNINLVKTHVRACRDKLPDIPSPSQSISYARAVIFAKSNTRTPDLTAYDFVRDMPRPESRLYDSDPICSIMTQSPDRSQCLQNIQRLANIIYKTIDFTERNRKETGFS